MPQTHEIPHGEILARCLAVLEGDPDHLLGYDVLAGGASGAYAYRLRFPAGDQFLKFTQPESPDYLLARARREMLFYRHLASEVRIQIPRAISYRCDKAFGVCLLLDAYEPCPAPASWTETRYVQAAELLGRLHGAFWGKEHELSTLGWLHRVDNLEEADIRQAYAHWERLRANERFKTILTPERYTGVLALLGRIRSAGDVLSSFPVTLCHGDFHSDNILAGPNGGMVLADWQETGLGRGPEDLSFFIQRASFSGGTVPCDAMIDAYQKCLRSITDEDIPVRDIRRVMDTAELRTRLLHWPAFLVDGSNHQLTDLLGRIQTLAAGPETTVQSRT